MLPWKSVHVVLLLRQHADIRPACELHTHRVWQSHADPDCDCDGHSHSNSNTYAKPDGDSDSDTDTWTEDYTDAEASSHASAETVANARQS